ncbi:DUF3035 domain-containing protein [Pelagibacterales bacterium SAG-MED13]|nr:DUF3035 domain-containing protein [Pelagibacterales bacterium SAG-MED13]
MKIIKNICIIIFIGLFLYSCKAAEGFKLKKKSSQGEEFLIEKKDPLVMPPEFSKLPQPDDELKTTKEEEIDFKTVLTENSSERDKNNSIEDVSENKIKKSILKQIQK